ncbi:uracil-DNA glycosylase family protein [Craterilacuibacter sinensis]|uniref:Uracil-DNA glycosylase family protein n=1 Tax=Craterilacuibacter sinensis TaxID=2686017 RepID=A0A845BLV5_9NEIS|nr:uracil-DNA glycosylase family protein [Craterilacuibacter sinensis]MXR36254.1 uracil-DNA glycosylase family protein [Craterilacuibacter sinensis]
MSASLDELLLRIRACRVCEPFLPLGPHPVVQAASGARILIAGQAPGLKVHQSGIAFDDASGERLRGWMGIPRALFYQADKIAIAPMGFCYPGKQGNADAPPRAECAPLWRRALLEQLDSIQLTLVIGRYAQVWHLDGKQSLTEATQAWRDHTPGLFVLPHPSPRNRPWLARNPWFEAEVVPVLRQTVARVLAA